MSDTWRWLQGEAWTELTALQSCGLGLIVWDVGWLRITKQTMQGSTPCCDCDYEGLTKERKPWTCDYATGGCLKIRVPIHSLRTWAFLQFCTVKCQDLRIRALLDLLGRLVPEI